MHATRDHHPRIFSLSLLLGLAVPLFGSCDPAEPDKLLTASASAFKRAPDIDRYCATMCQRAHSCGLELAKREAMAADTKLLAELERELPAREKTCRTECSHEPRDEAGRFQLERAQICLAKKTCKELVACIAVL